MKSQPFLYYTVYSTILLIKSREKAMKLIRTNSLTSRQTADAQKLEDECRQYDQTSLTFPLEIGCLTFLLYDEEVLLSAFSAYFQNEEYCECTAFTHPKHRRKGCFSKLLHEFLKEAGEVDLIFPVGSGRPDARLALEAMGTELLSQEFVMERKLLPANGETDGRLAGFREEADSAFEPSISFCREDTLYTIKTVGQRTGCFRLIFQENSVYLYGLEIQESRRRQGCATSAMAALLTSLSRLKAQQPNRLPAALRLQVSGANKPAMALYRKLGFQIADSLSYYLY